jgi:hypothetical protein
VPNTRATCHFEEKWALQRTDCCLPLVEDDKRLKLGLQGLLGPDWGPFGANLASDVGRNTLMGENVWPPTSCFPRGRVLHLCSIRILREADSKFSVISIARTRCPETLCSLFSIEGRFPKLNVAGSIPVSRSIFKGRSQESTLLHEAPAFFLPRSPGNL